MRSDIVKKGIERAPHRSLMRAAGVIESEEDFDKPFIAIVNSHTDCVPGHVHLDRVGELIKRFVREAGGVPFMFHTIGIDDGIAMGHSGMKYSLPSRELIADCVESMVRAHCFDGMICIPNCDKIIPGMLMAAMRVNIPAIFVSGGPMAAGMNRFREDAEAALPPALQGAEEYADLISVFQGIGAYQSGRLSAEELARLEKLACPTCGSCSGMFTANSMNCLCEALGMALPGNGTALAVTKEREALYRRAARQILQLVRKNLKPRDIATQAAFDNAFTLDMAMGGSTNTVLHTLAIAREAGIEYDVGRIDKISQRVPCLCKVSPSSEYHMQDVHRAGGIHTILGELKRIDEANGWLNDKPAPGRTPSAPRILTLSCKTVTGKTLGRNIEEWDIRSPACSAEAKIARLAGCSLPLTVDEAGAQEPRLPVKPPEWFPGDERALALWRLAAAWNVGDAQAAALVLDPEARLRTPEGGEINGAEAAAEWLKDQLRERGAWTRAELAALQRAPAVLFKRYEKSGGSSPLWVLRVQRYRKGRPSRVRIDARPAALKAVKPAGVIPQDLAVTFDPKDCVRTGENPYSREDRGHQRSLPAQLRAWVRLRRPLRHLRKPGRGLRRDPRRQGQRRRRGHHPQ